MTTKTTKTSPHPKGLGLDSPRVLSSAAVLVGCGLLAVGCWLLACCCCCFLLLALGIKRCCCQCISATGAGGAAGVGTDVVLQGFVQHEGMVVTRFHHSWSWSIKLVQFHTGDGLTRAGIKMIQTEYRLVSVGVSVGPAYFP